MTQDVPTKLFPHQILARDIRPWAYLCSSIGMYHGRRRSTHPHWNKQPSSKNPKDGRIRADAQAIILRRPQSHNLLAGRSLFEGEPEITADAEITKHQATVHVDHEWTDRYIDDVEG